MRIRYSVWFGVLGVHAAMLVGCEGTGLVIESEATGGSGGSDQGGSGSNANGGKGSDEGYGGESTGGAYGGDGAGASAGYAGAIGYGGHPAGGAYGGDGAGASAGYAGAIGYGGQAAGGGDGAGAFAGYAGGAGGNAAGGIGNIGRVWGTGGQFVVPEECNAVLAKQLVVPTESDMTTCHGFTLGSDPALQITGIQPIPNLETTHHMVLYQAPDGPLPAGTCPEDLGTPIYAWVPGTDRLVLPSDVGLGADSGRFILQVHSVNSTDGTMMPSAGVCLSLAQGRPHTARVTRLGATGVVVPPHTSGSVDACTPPLAENARILAVAMDLGNIANRGSIAVKRADGSSQVILDELSTPEMGSFIEVPVLTLDAGDVVRSTCAYENPTNRSVTGGSIGCNLWALAYPEGSLPAGDQACSD